VGGATFQIPGTVSPHLIPLEPLPAATAVPFWRRLIGAFSGGAARRSYFVDLPNGERHFEIMPGALERFLSKDFEQWLVQALDKPSVASKVVLDYLGIGGPSIYVRGLRRDAGSKPEFWIQISFSGCAGEAQVSANVAAHWAELWYRSRASALKDDYLVPFGFTPGPYEPVADPPFVPAGDLGYLEATSPEDRARYGEPMFLLDHAQEEAFEGDPRLQQLESRYAPLMVNPRCHCQICAPGMPNES
jgi:hypothetical protein